MMEVNLINELYANAYCKEDISKIENYEQAIKDNEMWECHHRTEIWWNCSRKELKDNECYYNRPAKELIFLTRAEHRALHNKCRERTEEYKTNISKALKSSHKFQEFMKEQGERNKSNFTGRHWYNDGVNNFFIFDEDAKFNYIKGRTYHHRRKK